MTITAQPDMSIYQAMLGDRESYLDRRLQQMQIGTLENALGQMEGEQAAWQLVPELYKNATDEEGNIDWNTLSNSIIERTGQYAPSIITGLANADKAHGDALTTSLANQQTGMQILGQVLMPYLEDEQELNKDSLLFAADQYVKLAQRAGLDIGVEEASDFIDSLPDDPAQLRQAVSMLAQLATDADANFQRILGDLVVVDDGLYSVRRRPGQDAKVQELDAPSGEEDNLAGLGGMDPSWWDSDIGRRAYGLWRSGTMSLNDAVKFVSGGYEQADNPFTNKPGFLDLETNEWREGFGEGNQVTEIPEYNEVEPLDVTPDELQLYNSFKNEVIEGQFDVMRRYAEALGLDTEGLQAGDLVGRMPEEAHDEMYQIEEDWKEEHGIEDLKRMYDMYVTESTGGLNDAQYVQGELEAGREVTEEDLNLVNPAFGYAFGPRGYYARLANVVGGIFDFNPGERTREASSVIRALNTDIAGAIQQMNPGREVAAEIEDIMKQLPKPERLFTNRNFARNSFVAFRDRLIDKRDDAEESLEFLFAADRPEVQIGINAADTLIEDLNEIILGIENSLGGDIESAVDDERQSERERARSIFQEEGE